MPTYSVSSLPQQLDRRRYCVSVKWGAVITTDDRETALTVAADLRNNYAGTVYVRDTDTGQVIA